MKNVDDSKITGFTKCEDDVIELQKVLDNIYKWATSYNMNWNNHKFYQVRSGNSHDLKEDTLYFSPEMTNVIEVK